MHKWDILKVLRNYSGMALTSAAPLSCVAGSTAQAPVDANGSNQFNSVSTNSSEQHEAQARETLLK